MLKRRRRDSKDSLLCRDQYVASCNQSAADVTALLCDWWTFFGVWYGTAFSYLFLRTASATVARKTEKRPRLVTSSGALPAMHPPPPPALEMALPPPRPRPAAAPALATMWLQRHTPVAWPARAAAPPPPIPTAAAAPPSSPPPPLPPRGGVEKGGRGSGSPRAARRAPVRGLWPRRPCGKRRGGRRRRAREAPSGGGGGGRRTGGGGGGCGPLPRSLPRSPRVGTRPFFRPGRAAASAACGRCAC